jgi:hypothetical protein
MRGAVARGAPAPPTGCPGCRSKPAEATNPSCAKPIPALRNEPRQPPPPSDNALRGLARHRDTVAKDKRRDGEKAIRQLRKSASPINVSTVAAKAGVQRKTVYKHRDLIAVIDQYRRQPISVDTDTATTGRETSIITALRRTQAAKDEEIKKLKATVAQHKTTIEMLYGQLDSHMP